MQFKKSRLLALLALFVSFLILYRDVIAKLIHDWSIDENYSHGFLVAPIALYFAWERREKFLTAAARPNALGLIVVIGSIGLLIGGILGAEVFTTEVSLLGVLAGSVLFLFGWPQLRTLLFPISFLMLMIPIPAIIFNQIAFPLQLLASSFGELALRATQIPVLREGNVIHLANISLEVAEACSGIRSLISLLTLGIVYGYFTDGRSWVRWGLGLVTAPIAIVANGFRVAGTGIAAHYYGRGAAEGFFHTFSGWIIFSTAFVMLFLVHRALVWRFPQRVAAVAGADILAVAEVK